MNQEQMQIIEAAISDALDAIPNGDDRQLTDCVMANRFNSFSPEVREALKAESLKHAIRERARELGVELQD
jgi:hypothetical protein